ncbi:MAG: Mu transposase C-terminal domain-containing protein [Lachnospiraceae bacterium]|nr:Mu transposase C-terminal domain-containing protein [Lachnospiraceae bacterium]MCM1240997.1 Mu transposase C-terminal domain-containing protein [Lachnospiraceae bacterium]
MGQMLTAKQVAEVKGCSFKYVQRIIKEKKIPAQEVLNGKNRKTYMVPLEALDEELQEKWYRMNLENPPEGVGEPDPGTGKKGLDHFSESERREIDFWTGLVEQWQQYRMKPGAGSKAEVDRKFVALCGLEYPDRAVSLDILYRKWRAVREDDLEGLLDRRGKWRKGTSAIDDTIWQAFLYYYLDQSQYPIMKCLEYTKLWAQEMRPDLYPRIPSYSAFYRRLGSEVPEGVKVLGREGQKAYDDRCAPYIRRIYEDIESNEWWIADNHTFDVMVRGKDGKLHRPHLTAFLDARSGIFTGFHITDSPSSEATLTALRKGIIEYGIPDNIYVDNGREFLTLDIGGLGHRKKKPKDGVEPFEPPGVFKRLGISMTNAIVRNAKAKIIERRFLDVKNDFSRLFQTYTGGNVTEKPERLKYVLKKGQVYTDEEFQAYVEAMLKWYFNMEPYNGAVKADRGKCKMDVYKEYMSVKRTAKLEDLRLMMMRSSRPQKVTRRGVHLDINGERFDYWNDEFVLLMLGKEVYYRYDPEDLSEVRIYDLEDRYIMTVPTDNEAVLSYNASKEDVSNAVAVTKRAKRIAKEYRENAILAEADRITAMELMLRKAERNKASYQGKPDPAVIEVRRADEEPLYKKVVGGADLDTMNKNAAKGRGGK